MDQKNEFRLRGIRCLLFDIFYKNNQVWLVLPVYDLEPFPSELIHVSIEGKRLDITTKHVNTYYYGPVCIYVYDYGEPSPSIDVTVEYEWRKKVFHLEHIETSEKSEMGLTTLCMDDYRLFTPFYGYYKDQGVTQFYIYYNGEITPEIKKFFEPYGKDVTLIEWNFLYKLNGDTHHAQTGQINHALYKYGKDNNKHMIFCDLDEYLHVPKTTLKEFVDRNNDINTFGFSIKWSQTIDGKIPDVFPRTFLTQTGRIKYPMRSKNIYKVSDLKILWIHSPLEYCATQSIICDLDMFHFYNWSRPTRTLRDETSDDLIIHTLEDGRA
jgi:hypothetical protein